MSEPENPVKADDTKPYVPEEDPGVLALEKAANPKELRIVEMELVVQTDNGPKLTDPEEPA